MSDQINANTGFSEVLGLTAEKASECLRIALSELPAAIESWPLSKPMFDKHDTQKTFVRDNIGFFAGLYEAQFNIWDNNNYEQTEAQKQSIHDSYVEDMASWAPMKRRLADAFSGTIVLFLIRKAEKSRFLDNFHIVVDTIKQLTGSELLGEFILQDVLFRLKVYFYELEDDLESSKKRGKYRRPEDRPRPDLPSNHYENLTTRPLGIRATEAMRNAVDVAASRQGVSRNEWVNAAMEEALLRDHPDLLMRRNVKPSGREPS